MFKRFTLAVPLALFLAVTFAIPAVWAGPAKNTGYLLRGTLYKQSGIAREGIITIRTAWALPAAPPVIRYDFDIIHGRIDDNLYRFMMADVAEIQFLPPEKKGVPVNIMLRNGLVQKVILSSDDKAIVGPVNLRVEEVLLTTDDYGENIVTPGELARIVFPKPADYGDESAAALVKRLGKALEIGRRDGLVDADFLKIIENLQRQIKAKTPEGAAR